MSRRQKKSTYATKRRQVLMIDWMTDAFSWRSAVPWTSAWARSLTLTQCVNRAVDWDVNTPAWIIPSGNRSLYRPVHLPQGSTSPDVSQTPIYSWGARLTNVVHLVSRPTLPLTKKFIPGLLVPSRLRTCSDIQFVIVRYSEELCSVLRDSRIRVHRL